jgi:hypothetical protein
MTMLKRDPTDEDFRKSLIGEIINKHSGAPRLTFIITTLDLDSGCAAVINADVLAPLKASTMISTGVNDNKC